MSKLIGQATKEQIEAWKKETKEKYGQSAKVFAFTLSGRICYLRSVDRVLYSLAVSKVSRNPDKFNELIIDGIWLGGDEDIRKIDKYYFSLIDFVEELMDKEKGQLGEL